MQYTLGNRTRLSSIGAMVGGYSSGRAEALNLISTLRNIPHLDPAALSPRLSDVKVSPRFLRVIPSGTLHGRMIAQLLSQVRALVCCVRQTHADAATSSSATPTIAARHVAVRSGISGRWA
ncbi:unnamed protein product [Pedinophyceae sp. YPF-701]|nr:unnamed protein product [Pedinophyceae sp. YPF-701]